jgi:hypothetical protein
MRRAAVFVAAALAAVAFTAEARQVCAPRDKIVNRLATTYGEARQGFGLQGGRLIVELYASAETGTWTIIATRPDGTACAMAAGHEWNEGEKILPPGPPA